jgi:hypothetical protein
MKRIISILTISFVAIQLAFSQNEFDLFKFVQPEINGTARYSSMAGAFGALGGDPSAIKDNPGGLGIYRSSEISGSLNLNIQETQTQWLKGNTSTEGLYLPLFNNFSFIMSFPASGTSLKYSNIAITINRLKDFDRSMRINGSSGSKSSITDYLSYFSDGILADDLYHDDDYNAYGNIYVPWLSVLAANTGLIFQEEGETYWSSLLKPEETVAPSYTMREKGYLNEYAFSWAGNFNNRLFLGITMNIYDLFYSAYADYYESFSEGGNMSLLNTFNSDASGLGLKLGAIYTPFNSLRLGFALQAPVFFTVKNYHYADMNSAYEAETGPVSYHEKTPEASYEDNKYKIQGPLTYNISGSYIIGKRALIGVEYGISHNEQSKFMDLEKNTFDYSYENDSIRTLFATQGLLKVGGEFKLTDKFAIRAGYAMANPVILSRIGKEFIPNTIRTDVAYLVPKGNANYWSAGFGYREGRWYIDLAVINKTYSERFYPYNYKKLDTTRRIDPGKVNTTNFNIVTTLGFRF